MKTGHWISDLIWVRSNGLSNLLTALIVFAFCNSFVNPAISQQHISIMFYNVENLFDTVDDTTKSDNEFLPEGNKKWNYYKYNQKLSNICKVILMAGEWNPPEIICLAEIENRKVLNDLVNKTSLSKYNYNIIHFESPDIRGIDCAILYKNEIVQEISSETIQIKTSNPYFKTRDILYSKLVLKTDTIHLFVNHWPSRRGGRLKSEPKRITSANVLKNKVDSLFLADNNPLIIITGDFNDTPEDKSLLSVLNATPDTIAFHEKETLVNLSFSYNLLNEIKTISYQNKWYLFDQMIVSSGMLAANNPNFHVEKFEVISHPKLLEEKKNETYSPNRTYTGPYYNGGFSDHLPVKISIHQSP